MTTTTINNQRQNLFILAGVLSAMFLASMDSTIVSTAMPGIIGSLNGMEYYTWPITIYMLCTAVVIPIVGKLSDSLGFKPLFIWGIGIFLAGSALCGASGSMLGFIICRGIQGIGAGILSANTLGIIGITFSPVERAKYLGLSSSVYGLASIVGPALGGFITDHLSWRWVFYINIPIGMMAVLLILFTLPKLQSENTNPEIDLAGMIFFILSIVPLLLALTWAGDEYAWSSVQIIGMLGFSALMAILFMRAETRAANPIIAFSLFRNSTFTISSLNMMLLSGILVGVVVFVPLFAQSILGTTATTSGAILTPMMISMVVSSALCGAFISRTKRYKLPAIFGMLVLLTGMYVLTTLHAASSNGLIILIMVLTGTAMGFTMPVFNIAVQNAFPKNEVGTVTSVLQFFRLLGRILFSAAFGTILSTSLENGMKDLNFGTLPDYAVSFLKRAQSFADSVSLLEIRQKLSGEMLTLFNQLLEQVKTNLSITINHVFLLCTILTVIAIISTWLLKELPLRENN